jgi:hypothetical protein
VEDSPAEGGWRVGFIYTPGITAFFMRSLWTPRLAENPESGGFFKKTLTKDIKKSSLPAGSQNPDRTTEPPGVYEFSYYFPPDVSLYAFVLPSHCGMISSLGEHTKIAYFRHSEGPGAQKRYFFRPIRKREGAAH